MHFCSERKLCNLFHQGEWVLERSVNISNMHKKTTVVSLFGEKGKNLLIVKVINFFKNLS